MNDQFNDLQFNENISFDEWLQLQEGPMDWMKKAAMAGAIGASTLAPLPFNMGGPQQAMAQTELEPEQIRSLTKDSIPALEKEVKEFVNKNDFSRKPFMQMLQWLQDIERNSSDRDVSQWANETKSELGQIRRQWNNVQRYYDALEKQPDHPQANLMVGQFELMKGNWEIGLQHLAKGQGSLAEMAQQTLSDSVEDKLAAADGWYKMERQFPIAKTKAIEIYKEILPSLEGLDKMRVEKLLSDNFDVVGTWQITFNSGFKIKVFLNSNGTATSDYSKAVLKGKWSKTNGVIKINWDYENRWTAINLTNMIVSTERGDENGKAVYLR